MATHDGVPAGGYNKVHGATAALLPGAAAVQNIRTALVLELLPLSGATAM